MLTFSSGTVTLFDSVCLTLNILDFQESLAFMFEMGNLHEDSLREYDELELCYSESGLYQILTDNYFASVLSFIVDVH